jgi:hypothetical protein
MLCACARLPKYLLPALVVAGVWGAWWVHPEQPLRSWSAEFGISPGPEVLRARQDLWALVVPMDGSVPTDLDVVHRFDPVGGCAERIATPNRRAESPLAHAPDASWWAWPDGNGCIHIVRLPDAHELWVTPPDSRRRPPLHPLKVSPDGRYLLVPVTLAGPIDVWEVATGAKRTTLDQLTGEILDWTFDSTGRLRIACRNPELASARIFVHHLPDDRAEFQADIPCATKQAAYFPEDERLVSIMGNVVNVWWDITVNPPRRLQEAPIAREVHVSTNGQFRVTIDSKMRSNWVLDEPSMNRTISAAADFGLSDKEFTIPYMPPNVPFDRYFVLASSTLNSPPDWAPGWLVRVANSRGHWQKTSETLFCDPSTGRLLRRLPELGGVLWPANGDVIWISGVSHSQPRGMAYHEWSLVPPHPPWWLWGLTAVVAAWYVRCDANRKTRQRYSVVSTVRPS